MADSTCCAVGTNTGVPRWSGKEPTTQCRRREFSPWVWKMPWRRKWQPTLALLLGKSHGQRSLAGYSPWSCRRVGHDLSAKQQQQQTNTALQRNYTPVKTDLRKESNRTDPPRKPTDFALCSSAFEE